MAMSTPHLVQRQLMQGGSPTTRGPCLVLLTATYNFCINPRGRRYCHPMLQAGHRPQQLVLGHVSPGSREHSFGPVLSTSAPGSQPRGSSGHHPSPSAPLGEVTPGPTEGLLQLPAWAALHRTYLARSGACPVAWRENVAQPSRSAGGAWAEPGAALRLCVPGAWPVAAQA